MKSALDFNVSRHLAHRAQDFPNKVATILANGQSLTFLQMELQTQRMAGLYQRAGIGQGTRVVVFVRPGLNFVSTIFGLFRIGAVPVFIDPGMKLKSVLACVKECKPEAMVGIPRAFFLSKLFPRSFGEIKTKIILWGSFVFNKVNPLAEVVCLEKNAPAAIIFTSGSTGIPKGVEVTHGTLELQQKTLKEVYCIEKDEVDLVVFPLFALFSAAWGITSVIPKMNPGKPAEINGLAVAKIMNQHGVTHTAGSPAIWKRVMEGCLKYDLKLPTVKRILMAGAPVSEKIIQTCKKVLSPNAEIYTPYGATEALPLTSISSAELFKKYFSQTKTGKGTCVGQPLPGIKFKIIAITDEAIATLADARVLPSGTVGEVIVQGDVVTRSYFNRPQSNQLAKIIDGDSFWHRMGDLGYIDDEGCLWFCGRKDHRVHLEHKELYPVQCEGVFNQHPNVRRSALVRVETNQGKYIPVLVVQPEGPVLKETLRSQLLSLAKNHVLTQDIEEIIFKNNFPTDTRHNIKINRPLLALYAQSKVVQR